MTPDILFLPAIISLGVVSSIQDLRVRRISNIGILIALGYAFIGHTVLFVLHDHQEMGWQSHYLVNGLISAVVAVYFWKQNWWGGGDAKLFICYSLLIPFSHYPVVYFHYYFASFLLLMATFIPAAIWTFLHAQTNLIREGRSIFYDFRASPLSLHHREFAKLTLGLIAIFFLMNLFMMMLNQDAYWLKDFPVILWFLGLGFYQTAYEAFKKKPWLLILAWVLAISIAMCYPFKGPVGVWQLLGKSFIAWLVIFVSRFYILKTIDKYVERSRNDNMAFAGWMFLGVLGIWFYRMIF